MKFKRIRNSVNSKIQNWTFIENLKIHMTVNWQTNRKWSIMCGHKWPFLKDGSFHGAILGYRVKVWIEKSGSKILLCVRNMLTLQVNLIIFDNTRVSSKLIFTPKQFQASSKTGPNWFTTYVIVLYCSPPDYFWLLPSDDGNIAIIDTSN